MRVHNKLFHAQTILAIIVEWDIDYVANWGNGVITHLYIVRSTKSPQIAKSLIVTNDHVIWCTWFNNPCITNLVCISQYGVGLASHHEHSTIIIMLGFCRIVGELFVICQITFPHWCSCCCAITDISGCFNGLLYRYPHMYFPLHSNNHLRCKLFITWIREYASRGNIISTIDMKLWSRK